METSWENLRYSIKITYPPYFIRNGDYRVQLAVLHEKRETARLLTGATAVHNVMRLVPVTLSCIVQLKSDAKRQTSSTLVGIAQTFT